MKFGCSIGIFLNSAHLICRTTDISKCFRGSFRLRDNESRLYLRFHFYLYIVAYCVLCVGGGIRIFIILEIKDQFDTSDYLGLFDFLCQYDLLFLISVVLSKVSETQNVSLLRLQRTYNCF